MSALNASKYGYPLEEAVLGDYDLVPILKKSTAPDFGLAKSHPYITELRDLIELKQFSALEKKIDLLLSTFADESVEERFSIEFIFAYFIKLAIGNRWLQLEEEAGMNALNRIIGNVLQTGVWPEEFSPGDWYVTGED